MMTLNHVDHRVLISEDESRQLDVFEIGRYRVERVISYHGNKVVYKNFTVYSDRNEEYLPEIYYNDREWWGAGKSEFEIQTTAYGSKGIDDIEKIVNGYKEAIEVVKVLTMNFC